MLLTILSTIFNNILRYLFKMHSLIRANSQFQCEIRPFNNFLFVPKLRKCYGKMSTNRCIHNNYDITQMFLHKCKIINSKIDDV